jgi:hypothetical protein
MKMPRGSPSASLRLLRRFAPEVYAVIQAYDARELGPFERMTDRERYRHLEQLNCDQSPVEVIDAIRCAAFYQLYLATGEALKRQEANSPERRRRSFKARMKVLRRALQYVVRVREPPDPFFDEDEERDAFHRYMDSDFFDEEDDSAWSPRIPPRLWTT